jgi:Ca2+-binding RTX toxin-like protein
MAISTNGLQLARIAGAVFNQQLSASDYSEILAANKTAAELDAWANAAVAAEFRNKTTTDIAKAVLANVGLSSVTGLEAWVAGQLTAGGGVAKAGATMLAMLNDFANMTADATYGAAAATFNTKAANSQALSQTAGTTTGTYAAVSTSAPAVVFPLTSGADVKTFGSGNDTINALFASATGMTFQATDSLDGGAGADIINVQVGVTGTHGAASMANVETVSANFSAAGTLSLLNTTGVTTVESSASTAAAAFSNIGSVATALKVSNTAQDATFGFTTAAVAGTADTVALTLSGVTGGTVALAGVETVGITSSGSANTLTGLTATSATTVNVAGDQALTLGTLSSSVTALNAGSNTAAGAGVSATMGAATTATITGGTGNDSINISAVLGDVSIAGGAGNDTVTVTTNLTTTDTISGGDGIADVLSTTAAVSEGYTAPTTRTISGFEQLTLSTAGSTSVTLTTANVDTGITRVNLAGTTAAYGVTGPAGALTVTSTAALGGTLTLTDTGTAITDSATLTNSGISAANVFNGAAVTSTGYETLTINSGSGSTITNNAAAQTLGAVTVTVDTGGASAVNFTGANSLTTGAVSATTISASGMTGSAALTMGSATGATSITGTANNDSIGASSVASSVTAGGGNDTINGGALNDTINGGDGVDSITGGVGRDSLTGGAGVDTFVFAQPTALLVTSNQAAPDTITDFVSGTDKISLGQTVTGFLGNYTSLASAQAAATADGRSNLAFFVSGDNTLYVSAAANGAVNGVTDTAISFTAGTVTSLTGADLQIGAQGTGSTIVLTAGASNPTTTSLDDAISSTAAFLANSTIDGGVGNDTLTISTAPTTAVLASLATASATGAVVSNVEVINLAAGSTNSITMPNTVGLKVSNTSSSAAATVAMGTGQGQTYSASGAGVNTVTLGSGTLQTYTQTGAGASVVAFGAAQQSVTGGIGGDTFTLAFASADRAVLTGGLGADQLNYTNGTTGLNTTFVSTGSPAAASATTGTVLMTGVEVLSYTQVGAGVLTITPDAAITVAFGGTYAGEIVGTGQTITTTGVATYGQTLSGTSNFSVSGTTTGAVTHSAVTGSGIVTVLMGDSMTVTNNAAVTDVVNITNAATAASKTLTLAGTGTGFTVNGLGLAATGGTLTEGTAYTGNTVVNVTGTVANSITQASTATGAGTYTINHSGTGTTTLTALAIHGTTVVNASGATGNLVGAAESTAPINYTATAGAHMINLSAGTTAVNDTITGFSGTDTIIGGLGRDFITTGGGADSIRMIAGTATGTVLGFTQSTAIPTTAIFVGSSDVITGFANGMNITIGTAIDAAGATTATGHGANAIVRNGGTMGTGTTGDVALITGTYTASTSFFTPSISGTDSLYVYDDNGTTAAGSYRAVVLVGYVDTGTVDTLSTTGILTAVL